MTGRPFGPAYPRRRAAPLKAAQLAPSRLPEPREHALKTRATPTGKAICYCICTGYMSAPKADTLRALADGERHIRAVAKRRAA